MKQRCLDLLLILLFSTGVFSASIGAAGHASTAVDEVHHAEGSTCPDPDSEGHPCGPSCACTCCPGQMNAATIATVHPIIAAQLTDELDAAAPDALCPKEVVDRVFHPPRA